ncbi:hypothetical protein [Devosia sediminis]|uniref:CheA signal transduction histidine kinase n=1 Tax=Devosia sediminis TaxID=2798801 RepID=A0A934J231_9HYPH|nr:hypothetical protein [Devosia sediminis]MBJ3786823.1 hypothetical protein [Devosia sediminis]
MADYKELLRRAISALPENNGAARRAVYEKARSALVGQLRAIQPPLPARDITQHRLQLEDCIRQVEQEASEAVISLGRDGAPAARQSSMPAPAPSRPAPAPVPTPSPAPVVAPPAPPPVAKVEAKTPEPIPPKPEPVLKAVEPAPVAVVEKLPEPKPEAPVSVDADKDAATASIEDIIAQAEAATADDATDSGSETTANKPLPFEIRPVNPAPGPAARPSRPSLFAPRSEPVMPVAVGAAASAAVLAPRVEPVLGSTALASQPVLTEPVVIGQAQVDTALSTEREVEVEQDDTRAAEGAIERAIETLDREARGETTEPLPDRADAPDRPADTQDEDAGFAPAGAVRRSGAGLTIFLIVFAVLLAGVGGAGFWAWREGYVDLDQMFGRAQPATTQVATETEPVSVPTMDSTPPAATTTSEEGASGPGNTATTTAAEPTSALEVTEDRLEPTPEPVTPTGNETVLPSIGAEPKGEERLSGEETSIAAVEDPAATVDPALLAGNQSLLLEASTNGQGGAVPFSGTVEWSQGTDELGLPTLVGEASIPARNLGVAITIRKNNDPVLPASHLMEITFDVPETFIGGSIATLAGVLLKDEELVPGTALAGAAARIVGNTFLFALSASPDDLTSNTNLLDTRRWMDLAIVYGTGRNAILTLEKDEDAQTLFDTVLAAWDE